MGSMNYYIERCLWSQTLSPEARPPPGPHNTIGLCIDERGVGLLDDVDSPPETGEWRRGLAYALTSVVLAF